MIGACLQTETYRGYLDAACIREPRVWIPALAIVGIGSARRTVEVGRKLNFVHAGRTITRLVSSAASAGNWCLREQGPRTVAFAPTRRDIAWEPSCWQKDWPFGPRRG
jgi:hypothetical protein